MRHLAYFRPHGQAYGPVTYLLVPAKGFRGYRRLRTIDETGKHGHLYVHAAQVLGVAGKAVARVLARGIPGLPEDVKPPATIDWCHYSAQRVALIVH